MQKILFSLLSLLIITKIQSRCPGSGTISFQRWNNITGGTIINLTSNTNYPNNPTSSSTQSLFEMQQDLGNDLSIKMYGDICPPATGNYVFWISSNNSGELRLSTCANSTEKVRIAYNTSGNSSREWNMFTTQKSAVIAMTRGQKYYVEALMKESTGSDNLAVGWAKPGESTTYPSEVIPGTSLSINSSPDSLAPSAPTTLTAANITINSFTLAWTAATDNEAVTGYDVYRGTVKLNTAIVTTTSFNVTGLAPNTAYSMTVRARDANANETVSSPLSVSTLPDIQAPSAPTNLRSSNITVNSFTLAWNASTDNVAVTGYDVYRGTVKLNTAIITTTSFIVTGLAPNTAYSMTVRARDANANETASGPLSVSTLPDIQVPSAPTNLRTSNITVTSFTLAWNASTDNVAVTGYDVYRGTVKLNTAIVTTTSFNVTGLAPNTSYSMTVRARDANANETVGSPLSVSTLPDIQVPSAPTNLRTSNITVTSFALAWNVSTDNVAVTGYDVYRGTVKLNTAIITTPSFSLTGLAPNTSYSMTVRARDAATNETASSPLSVSTLPDIQAPSAPTNLRTSNINVTSFTLAWNVSTDNVAVTGYDVYRNGVKLNANNIAGTTYSVTGLTPNTIYSMTVRARDAVANETGSTPFSATTIPDTQVPSVPSNLRTSNMTMSSFTLAWNASTDNVKVTGYDVYRNAVKINTANITGLTFNVSGLTPSTNYSMTVRAKDAATNETESNALPVTTNDIPDTLDPSAPTGLIATDLSSTSFTLSWSAASDNIGVTGYDVYSDTLKLNASNITGLSYNVTGLSPITAYSMTVRARDAAKNETSSSPLSVTTNPDRQVPSAPTNLAASSITFNSITLSWNAATDNVGVTGYDVFSDSVKLNASDITGLSFNVTGLSPITAYLMTVRAKDAATNEAESNALSVTTKEVPDTLDPSAPTELIATDLTTTSFTLSWSAASDNIGVTGYDVYSDTLKLNASNITGLSYNVTGLSPSTNYSITVRARDSADNETASSSIPVTTNADTQVPTAPTNLAASGISSNSFILTWTAAIDNVAVTGYDVYSDSVKLNASNITGLSYNATGLSPITAYSMTVRAKDAAANEAASSVLLVTTPEPPPPSAILTLPLAAAMILTKQSNVIIENLRFENISGIAINIYSSNNITIRNCFFNRATEEAINVETSTNIIIENCLFNGVQTGVYIWKTQNVKVRNNQFVNMRMRPGASRGQFVQFNEVTGAGNAIENNKGENFPGESDPEDLISLYKSSGTSASYISVRNNIFRGGGPSTSGSGIVVGDNGGNYTVIENNTLLDPGQAGIAVASGSNISVLNNKIFARQQPFANNPLYVWKQSATTCSNITIKGNRVNWTNKDGEKNNGWNAGNCISTVFEKPTTITLEEMNVPAHLITFLTEAELLMIRGSFVENKQLRGSIAVNLPKL